SGTAKLNSVISTELIVAMSFSLFPRAVLIPLCLSRSRVPLQERLINSSHGRPLPLPLGESAMARTNLTRRMLLRTGLAAAGMALGGGRRAAAMDEAPTAEIRNDRIRVKLYLPDAGRGYYRGTRFDWSGMIGGLEYAGHRYYGPWFDRIDPPVRDFTYAGAEIVVGRASGATGPAEEFVTGDTALGFEEAAPGGAFGKIGGGALRKPHDAEDD